jgi:hypothetical protein
MLGKLLLFRRREVAPSPTLEQLMAMSANMGHGVETDFIRRRRDEIARMTAEDDCAYYRHVADLSARYNSGQRQRSDRDRAVKDFTRVCEQTSLIDKLRKE